MQNNVSRPSRHVLLLAIASLLLIAGVTAVFVITQPGAMRRGRSRGNFLLITVDTLRPDHLGCYGYKNIKTPVIDRLAAEGLRFEKVVSASSLTTPSHASILTGTYPTRHTIRDNSGFALASGCRTLAQIFKEHGYATGAVVSGAPLAAEFGLNRGFDFYDDTFTSVAITAVRLGDVHAVPEKNEKKAGEATAAALNWLKSLAEKKDGAAFFLWVHYYDPHVAYHPPSPFCEEYRDNLYDGEIAYTDACIGDLLDGMREIGVYESTHVILTADHGESLGQHGEQTHGIFIYDSTILVPLILCAPSKISEGVVYPQQVRTIDIMPTILDMAGIPAPPDIHGQSLLPGIADESARPRLAGYMENYACRINFGWRELRGMRTDHAKYIATTLPEFYQLDEDPGEAHNLAGKSEDAERMRDQLNALIKELDADASATQRPTGSAAVLAQLRSLGYAAGGYGLPLESDDTPRPDPKQMIEVGNELLYGIGLARRGDIEGCIVRLRDVCEKDPTNVSVWDWLACFYKQAGYLDDAVSAYRKAAGLAPESLPLKCELGDALMQVGDINAAEEVLRKAIEITPGFAPAHKGLGDVLYRMGRVDEAIKAYEQAIQLDPKFRDARLELAFVTTIVRDRKRGMEQFGKIVEEYPRDARVRRVFAEALRALQKYKEAVDELNMAISLAPDEPDAYLDLADLLLNTGHYKEAQAPIARSLQIVPDSARAADKLGTYYLYTGEKQKAEMAYRKAVYLSPRSSEFHNDLGAALQEQGKYAEAIQDYENAVRLDDKNADAFFNLGAALLQAKRDVEGGVALRRALALRPDRAPRVVNLLRQLLAIEPENKAARKLLDKILPKDAEGK